MNFFYSHFSIPLEIISFIHSVVTKTKKSFVKTSSRWDDEKLIYDANVINQNGHFKYLEWLSAKKERKRLIKTTEDGC